MSEETKKPETPEPKPAKGELIRIEEKGVALRSFEDMQRWSQMVVASGMAPKDWDVAKVAVAIQTGMEVGLPGPMTALRSIYVVGGLPTFKGNAALALIRRSPLCEYIDVWCENDEQGPARGVCVSKRKGQPQQKDAYTREQAQLARRWNKKTRSGEDTPWVTDADMMLQWRAVGRHVQKYWSDVTFGIQILEATDDENGGETPPRPEGPRTVAPPEKPLTPDPLLEGEEYTELVDAEPAAGPQVAGGMEGMLRESIARNAKEGAPERELRAVATGKPVEAQAELEKQAGLFGEEREPGSDDD